ncbi:MAG: hypothetical protein XE06_0069 [Anaerolineaceae bacterium 46_22]|nr:MAG: hypothetical protein XE06_0069 [Anaerolineaceae bacterium 46_22]
MDHVLLVHDDHTWFCSPREGDGDRIATAEGYIISKVRTLPAIKNGQFPGRNVFWLLGQDSPAIRQLAD